MNREGKQRHSPWGESSRRLGEGNGAASTLAEMEGRKPSPAAARPTLPEGGWLLVCLVLALQLLVCSNTSAQDTLVIKSKKTGEVSKRRGTIESWQGNKIRMAVGSRQREFDSADIVEVQTDWPQGYLEGKKLLKKRDFGGALLAFKKAHSIEQRDWVKHELSAGIIESLQATGNHAQAIAEFIPVVTMDTETRLFNQIPLQWIPSPSSRPAESDISKWIKSQNSAVRLIGASWQKATPTHRSALDVLQSLLQDSNPIVVHLATAQLWNPLTASEKDLKRWQRQLDAMPESLRAGPYLSLADAQSRNKMHLQAATNLMRIPILYPRNHSLIPPALYRAGAALENAGRKDEAKRTWSELTRNYPSTEWSDRVKEGVSNAGGGG